MHLHGRRRLTPRSAPRPGSGSDGGQGDFGAYLAGRGDEVTADILKVADARAQATSRDQISKVYGSMRGKAADLIKESLPAIGATLQKHAG